VGQGEAGAANRANRINVNSPRRDGRQQRILFLYSDTGGGHRAAAQAIDGALRDLPHSDDVRTEHVDAFASCGMFPLREGVASYGSMLKVQPSPYPAIYHLTNGQTRFRVISELGLPFIRRNFRRLLTASQPNLVVSVHPLLNTYARDAIDAIGLDARLCTVITDLATIHHSWTAGRAADQYVVPSAEAHAVCRGRGIPEERIHDFGLPIRKGFLPRSKDLAAAKTAIGREPQRPLLLVMAGAEGGGRVKRLLRWIGPSLRRLDLQLVAVAGRNEALRDQLREWAEPFGSRVEALGFIDNVADYMRASDLLLTKAGPGTIAEAAACGLPVLLFDYISGQEKGNLAYVVARGSGVVARDRDTVVDAIDRLFSPGSHDLIDMSEHSLASARPEAARRIAQFLMKLLHPRVSALGLIARP
jgi:1,2-diacylglycerol 3-beta-galactosyltransferase